MAVLAVVGGSVGTDGVRVGGVRGGVGENLAEGDRVQGVLACGAGVGAGDGALVGLRREAARDIEPRFGGVGDGDGLDGGVLVVDTVDAVLTGLVPSGHGNLVVADRIHVDERGGGGVRGGGDQDLVGGHVLDGVANGRGDVAVVGIGRLGLTEGPRGVSSLDSLGNAVAHGNGRGDEVVDDLCEDNLLSLVAGGISGVKLDKVGGTLREINAAGRGDINAGRDVVEVRLPDGLHNSDSAVLVVVREGGGLVARGNGGANSASLGVILARLHGEAARLGEAGSVARERRELGEAANIGRLAEVKLDARGRGSTSHGHDGGGKERRLHFDRIAGKVRGGQRLWGWGPKICYGRPNLKTSGGSGLVWYCYYMGLEMPLRVRCWKCASTMSPHGPDIRSRGGELILFTPNYKASF